MADVAATAVAWKQAENRIQDNDRHQARTTLDELLADGVRFDPHYLPSMNSDHMPMTLCALYSLGADARTLQAYRHDYARVLRPVASPPGTVTGLIDWRDARGDVDAYGTLLICLQTLIGQQGIKTTVADILPALLPGMAAQAFHPVIRLAYGIEFCVPAEVAAALAYMITTTVEVPLATAVIVDLQVMVEEQAQKPVDGNWRNFGEGLQRLLQSRQYPQGRVLELAECAALALAAYRSTRNFFALHMVTATQAVRVCSPYVDSAVLLAATTGALLAAHRLVGSPKLGLPAPAPDKLDREHCYKYVYACLAEYRHYADQSYLEEVAGFCRQHLVAAWAGDPALQLRY